MSFEFEPQENHTCPLFSQILNEFSQSILCHAFTLLFPVTLHPHVRHYSAQALPRIFWTPRTRGFATVIRHVAHSSIRGSRYRCFRNWQKKSFHCIFLPSILKAHKQNAQHDGIITGPPRQAVHKDKLA